MTHSTTRGNSDNFTISLKTNVNGEKITDKLCKIKEKIKLATVFSGIGAIEHAFQRLNLNHEIVFACDTDKYCKQTYFANYDISQERWYDDIRLIDGAKYGNAIDLFVGGSPCQSFSTLGKRKGFEDERGGLLFEFIRLINEIKPKVFIFENVKSLLSHNNGKTFIEIKNKFDMLGYKYFTQILNAKDYGIPQNRERLFIVGFLEKDKEFFFPKPIPLKISMRDLLIDNPQDKYFLSEKAVKYISNEKSLKKKFTQISGKIALCQKANQQYNWRGDFVLERCHSSNENRLRKLTPRECMRLMGFSDDFKIVVSDTQAYKQAGNSIVVDVLINILKSIYEDKN
jgi:DNA (cytosine-5)-methyltransferase 1